MIKLAAFNMDCTLFPEASNIYIARYLSYPVEKLLYQEKELVARKHTARAMRDSAELSRIEDAYTEILNFRRGITPFDLDQIFGRIPFYEGIEKTVDTLNQRGVVTALLTTGPEPIAARCQSKFGFHIVHATNWEFGDSRFIGKEENDEWNKSKVIARYQKEQGIDSSATAVIEYADQRMCQEAGLVVFFNPDASMQNYHSLPNQKVHTIISKDMGDVLKILEMYI